MAVSDGFRDFLIEQLAPLGSVTLRRMFGGGGVYTDGLMFGLVADDVLFLKVDDGNRAIFQAEGSVPFVYEAKGKSVTMSYWRLPERLYDEPEDLLTFARAALGAARRGAKSPKGKSGKLARHRHSDVP